MDETVQADQVRDALIEFESLVNAPPEEERTSQWCEQLKQKFERLESLLQARRRQIHNRLCGELATDTPKRDDEVQRLQQADHDIASLVDVLKTNILVLSLPKSQSEQGSVEQQILELTERGNELVFRIKDQEETVAARFAEVFADKT